MPRVLVVDDNPVARGLAVYALESAGMEVVEAADGAEALRCLEADPDATDVVVLDIMMPGLSGHDVLSAWRRRGLSPNARVVMLSCKTDDDDVTKAFSAGADEYLTKPYDPDELARVVRAAVYRTAH